MRYVNLIVLVIARQSVHDEVHPEAHAQLFFSCASEYEGTRVPRPGIVPAAGPVISSDDDRRYVVAPAHAVLFDPDFAGSRSPGKLFKKIKGSLEGVIFGNGNDRWDA